MVDRHAVSGQPADEPPARLRREHYLWHQDYHSAARRKHPPDQPDVDLGLARSRDAEEQVGRKAAVQLASHGIDCCLLLGGERLRHGAIDGLLDPRRLHGASGRARHQLAIDQPQDG
jgi:hypothetical protein